MDDKPTLLIVDDNAVNRQVLHFILQDHYRNLSTASNGEECLQQLEQRPINLILLDLNMPVKSGFEVLQEIQHLDPSHKPSVIVVSADNNPATISRALQMGASDYVTPPFNRDELLARVKTHLSLHFREQDLEERVQRRTAELKAANARFRSAQQQLIMSEKMASLGLLSAGIAHEINNPIGYILSNLESLQDYANQLFQLLELYQHGESEPDNPTWRETIRHYQDTIQLPFLKEDTPHLIEDAIKGAQRVRQIVTDLKVFSHPEQHQWELLDLSDCLHSVLNIIRAEIKYKAQVKLHIADELPAIECIAPQIYQVFTNLLINAAQAIDTHGQIDVTMNRLDTEPDFVEITIADTGQGMSDEIKTKIFDPFFTTKPVGKGTGLGLSVTYGIIESHQGRIRVESQEGKGTRMIVCLPIHHTATEN